MTHMSTNQTLPKITSKVIKTACFPDGRAMIVESDQETAETSITVRHNPPPGGCFPGVEESITIPGDFLQILVQHLDDICNNL